MAECVKAIKVNLKNCKEYKFVIPEIVCINRLHFQNASHYAIIIFGKESDNVIGSIYILSVHFGLLPLGSEYIQPIHIFLLQVF